MCNNDMTVYCAFLDVRSVAEHLLIAHNSEGHGLKFHLEHGIRELAKAADKLGFDLVKREPLKTEEAA